MLEPIGVRRSGLEAGLSAMMDLEDELLPTGIGQPELPNVGAEVRLGQTTRVFGN